MENQHRLIKGYRELSQEEIEAINRIKEEGQRIGELIGQHFVANTADARWLAIARTHLQEGFMAWVRAYAKPESF